MSNMTLVPAKPVADQAHAPKPDTMKLRHVVESQQLTVPLLMELFNRSRGMERVVARGGTLDYQNRILATMFYQPSTRTRFCFEAAMHRLGGKVLSTEHARNVFVGDGSRAGGRLDSHYRQLLRRDRDAPSGRRRGAEGGEGFARTGHQCRRRRWGTASHAGVAGSVHDLSRAAARRTERRHHRRTRQGADGAVTRLSAGEIRASEDLLCEPARTADEARHSCSISTTTASSTSLESDIDRVIGEVDVVYQTRIRPERVRRPARTAAVRHQFDSPAGR